MLETHALVLWAAFVAQEVPLRDEVRYGLARTAGLPGESLHIREWSRIPGLFFVEAFPTRGGRCVYSGATNQPPSVFAKFCKLSQIARIFW